MNMKSLVIATVAMMAPLASNAAITYRVEQVGGVATPNPVGLDSEALARTSRFYVGGYYNFALWNGYTDSNDVHVGGKSSSSFDVVAGMRVYDTFRIEANYTHTAAKWTAFSLTGETAFVNAIFDARIDNIYRLFRSQKLVPYVGLGAGLSWNKADDVSIENKYTPTAAALAGLGIELGNWFTIDLGYRYFYMFTPKFDSVYDLNPSAHQFRAGVRVHF